MKRLTDKLSALAPLPPRSTDAAPPIDDLVRIMSLPRREPVVCKRDDEGRYPPATQALIEHMTAKFTRGSRVSCACRPRRVEMVAPGVVSISRVLPEGASPQPPLICSVQALSTDWSTCSDEIALARRVAAMSVGEQIDLPAAGEGIGHPCILQLNPQQSWTLYEAPIVGGIVGFMGVGSGKTVTGILIPLLFPDAKLAVLCIEPKQRRHYRTHYLRIREHHRVPSIVFDDGVSGYTVPGTVPLHLLSYSRLSRTENSDILDNLSPNILILDEAHRACGDSAINRRVKRFAASKIAQREASMARGEKVRSRALHLFDWSGTLENKSVQDTQMLCAYSLGMGSPLPLDPDVAVAFSAVMDVSRRPDRESKMALRLYDAFGSGSVQDPLIAAMFGEPEREVRQGFQKRRSETVGVITASASSINASIYFSARTPPKMPAVVHEALLKVRSEHIRPDGADLEDRLDQVICAREVGCGFYTYWAFPKHPCACPPESPGNCTECRLIADWFTKRKAYNKELRTLLQRGEVYLDSPDLCRSAAERFWQNPPYKGKLPTWSCESWPAWRDIENKVQYEERVKWLGSELPEAADPKTHPGYYLARDAAEWALANKGVVWFRSIPLGRKIAELSGLPYFNGGPGCEERLNAEKGNRSIICSIKALGAGTDGLQYKFSEQLLAEMLASNGGNEGMEQLLGRLHREGQPADVVSTYGYLHTTEFVDAFRQVRMQAEYHYDMQKLEQRIRLADIDFEGA